MPRKEDAKETKHAEPEVDNVVDAMEEHEDSPKNLSCPDFKINRLYFRATKPDSDATQLMSFPKYLYDSNLAPTPENFEKHGESLIVITKPIKMSKGGIPKHNPKYHTADVDSMKRAYFYIPKVENDPNSMELFTMLSTIDKYLAKEINEKQNTNSVVCYLNKEGKRIKFKGLTYTPMITTAKPQQSLDLDDDDDDGSKKNNKNEKKEFVPWDRVKIKFATLYDENLGPNDRKDITTQIYVGAKEEAEKVKTVSDVEKHFMWNCTAQFALMFNKMWIKKLDDKECGIGIKCIQIGVTEQPEYKKSVGTQLNKKLFAFGGSSSVPSTPSTETKKDLKKETTVNNDDDDDDDDKDDDNDDNEDNDNSDTDNNDKDDDDNASNPESDDDSNSKKKKGKEVDVKVANKSKGKETVASKTEKNVTTKKSTKTK